MSAKTPRRAAASSSRQSQAGSTSSQQLLTPPPSTARPARRVPKPEHEIIDLTVEDTVPRSTGQSGHGCSKGKEFIRSSIPKEEEDEEDEEHPACASPTKRPSVKKSSEPRPVKQALDAQLSSSNRSIKGKERAPQHQEHRAPYTVTPPSTPPQSTRRTLARASGSGTSNHPPTPDQTPTAVPKRATRSKTPAQTSTLSTPPQRNEFSRNAAPLSPAATPTPLSRPLVIKEPLSFPVPKNPGQPNPFAVPTFKVVWCEDEEEELEFLCLGLENGDVLSRYQTWDAYDIFEGMHTRFMDLRSSDENVVNRVVEGLQGAILNYEMGLGKTHVTVVVLYLSIIYRQAFLRKARKEELLKPDLIIAPTAVHHQWIDHIHRISGGRMKAVVYPGGRTLLDKSANVIITTFDTFRNHRARFCEEYLDLQQWALERSEDTRTSFDGVFAKFYHDAVNGSLKQNAPMAITQWNCVVVDECHLGLANAATMSSVAALTAASESFILLSGTVAQNKMTDWQVPYNLVMKHISVRRDTSVAEQKARLRAEKPKKGVRKFGDMKMKQGEIVDYIDGHTVDEYLPWTVYTRRIVNPVTQMSTLPLPPMETFYVAVALDKYARMLHNRMKQLERWPIVRVLRQRQTCINPKIGLLGLAKSKLMDAAGTRGPTKEEERALKKDFKGETLEMGLLSKLDPDEDAEMPFLPSSASVHAGIKRGLHLSKKNPLANPGDEDEELKEEAFGIASELGIEVVLEDEYISGKFAAALEVLQYIKESCPGDRTIIFSMFTLVLDEFGKTLTMNGIPHVKYDGRMKSEEKQAALNTIAEDPKKKIILVSMKAGGVGLNITACNHVIILDPWWNPYVEEQAIARAYRKGQTKKVHVYHIVCPKSIEDKVNKTKEKKKTEIDAFTNTLATMRHKMDEARVKEVDSPWARPMYS